MKRDLGSVDLKGDGGKKEPPKVHISRSFERCLIYVGVLLPVIAIVLEGQFHFCARSFFDPFPSNAHTILCALIPFSSLLAWLSLKRNMISQFGLTVFTNGMAVGVAILYSLMFLPIMYDSLMSIPYFGIGLLGLAPFLALIVLCVSGHKATKVASSLGTYFQPHQVNHAGHLVILALVLAVELPSTITRIALNMASKPESQQQGLDILRAVGSQEVMLRACYERSGRATDIVGSLYEVSHPTNVEQMRNVFYKATGRTFNSFPIPEAARATMNHMGKLGYDGMDQGADDEFDMDPDVAGEMVSGVSRGLSVSQSKIQAKVDSDGGVSQLDWFLDFSNKSKFDREVRTRIKLPHGAAINDAGLIVNGKEYKCGVTLREEARAIYRAAVESKRNPLLVSLCGEDTVLVQCYPVPPGDKLSLHLSAVAPLALDKKNNAVLALPQFEERNFQITVPHTMILEANHEISTPWGQLKQEHPKSDIFKLSGPIESSKLATGGGIVSFKRSDDDKFYCKDNFNPAAGANRIGWISEKIVSPQVRSPRTLYVIVDLSVCMGEHMKDIVEGLHHLQQVNVPKDSCVSIICVNDRGDKRLCGFKFIADKKLDDVLKKLSEQHCAGGQTDGAALYQALCYTATNPGSSVLWLHGAQPLDDGYACRIKDLLANQTDPQIYDMQLSSGPNSFLDGVTSSAVQKVARFGSVADDLAFLFESWSKPGVLKKFSLTQFSYNGAPDPAPFPHCGPISCEAQPAVCLDSARAADVVVCDASIPAKGQAVAVCATGLAANPDLQIAPAKCFVQENLDGNKPVGKETLAQLAQLWAVERINYCLRHDDEAGALALAGRYHLVSPVSSAVLADTVPELERMSRPQLSEEEMSPLKRTLQSCAETIMMPMTIFRSMQMDHFSMYDGVQVNQLNRLSSVPGCSGGTDCYSAGTPCYEEGQAGYRDKTQKKELEFVGGKSNDVAYGGKGGWSSGPVSVSEARAEYKAKERGGPTDAFDSTSRAGVMKQETSWAGREADKCHLVSSMPVVADSRSDGGEIGYAVPTEAPSAIDESASRGNYGSSGNLPAVSYGSMEPSPMPQAAPAPCRVASSVARRVAKRSAAPQSYKYSPMPFNVMSSIKAMPMIPKDARVSEIAQDQAVVDKPYCQALPACPVPEPVASNVSPGCMPINGVNTVVVQDDNCSNVCASNEHTDESYVDALGQLDLLKVFKKFGFVFVGWVLMIFAVIYKIVDSQLSNLGKSNGIKNTPQANAAFKIVK